MKFLLPAGNKQAAGFSAPTLGPIFKYPPKTPLAANPETLFQHQDGLCLMVSSFSLSAQLFPISMHVTAQIISLVFSFSSRSPSLPIPHSSLLSGVTGVLIHSEQPPGPGTSSHDSIFEIKPGEVLHLLQKPHCQC